MNRFRTLLLVFFLVNSFCYQPRLWGQEKGVFTDERDGKAYATVTYSIKSKDSTITVTWMAQNLNFQMPESVCFNNDPKNCVNSGRLYTWKGAMQACPVGWSLPSDNDWYQLVELFGGINQAGRHLKAKKKVWPEGKGTNKAIFNGLPTGSADSNGFYNSNAGFFWSSTIGTVAESEASDWSFVAWSKAMRHWQGGLGIGNAVRCVKN